MEGPGEFVAHALLLGALVLSVRSWLTTRHCLSYPVASLFSRLLVPAGAIAMAYGLAFDKLSFFGAMGFGIVGLLGSIFQDKVAIMMSHGSD